MNGWSMKSSLFASGDRKIQMIHVTDELPNPEQVAAVYLKLALLFDEARKEPDNQDAQVHRIEVVITPEIEPTGER